MVEDHFNKRLNYLLRRYEALGESEDLLSHYIEFIARIADTVGEGILILDDDLTVQFANRAFCELFEVPPVEIVDCSLFEFGNRQWDIPECRELLERVLAQNEAVKDFVLEQDFNKVGHCVLRLSVCGMDPLPLILFVIENITEGSEALLQLRELNETLEQRIELRSHQVRTLSSQLAIAERDERHRIALLLDDDLQQRLYSVLMQMTILRQLLDNGQSEEALQEAQEIEQMLRDSVEASRNLSTALSPPILYDEGLTEAIGWLASHMNQRYDLAIQVKADASFPVRDEGLLTMLYQMIRELLFNVIKHAATSHVKIHLARADAHVRISIRDEGRGFDPRSIGLNPQNRHSGLVRIRHRLHLLGGSLKVESAPDAGTQITIVAPLQFPLGIHEFQTKMPVA